MEMFEYQDIEVSGVESVNYEPYFRMAERKAKADNNNNREALQAHRNLYRRMDWQSKMGFHMLGKEGKR